jgi:AbrB family looped-hinge helix DNA binding protein
MLTKIRERSQITLPNDIVKKLDLKTGDNLEITTEEDRIIIKPVLVIDRSQSWFWTEEWQKKERDVEEEIKQGKINKAKDVEDLIKKLES